MAIINHSKFKSIRKKYNNKKMVYVSGTFDLTHANHVIFFEKAKKLGEILVVGVGPDIDIKNHKGKSRPILDQNIRLKMVDSLKPVDYCFIGKKMLKKVNSQTRLLEILDKLRPNIYYLNNDAHNMDFRDKACKKYGVKIVISRPSSMYGKLTTSKIIAKIQNS